MARSFPFPAGGIPSDKMLAAFETDGFLVLTGFASPQACTALRDRVHDLIADFDPESVRTVFSTTDQAHARDAYFRESGDKVRFFFEAGAFDDAGRLTRDKHGAINKIGHALHDLDAVFAPFSHDPRLMRMAVELGLARPEIAQSMLIVKPPFIGGEVGMHQDATFLHTEPVSVTGFWIALEDATAENGCLFAPPGGHRTGLRERFHYEGDALVKTPLDPAPIDDTAAEPLEAPEGTLVVLHGLLPHRSGPNTSARRRLAYALHAVDATTRWSPDNWLKRGTADETTTCKAAPCKAAT